MVIDTSFDFRTDAAGKDPDVNSPTLRKYHKRLWSKALPNGRLFELDDTVRGAYLHHRSELGEFFLSSDSVIPTFTRWGFAKAHPELYTEEENKAFMAASYTIGGMMVFPGNRLSRLRQAGSLSSLSPLTQACLNHADQGEEKAPATVNAARLQLVNPSLTTVVSSLRLATCKAAFPRFKGRFALLLTRVRVDTDVRNHRRHHEHPSRRDRTGHPATEDSPETTRR